MGIGGRNSKCSKFGAQGRETQEQERGPRNEETGFGIQEQEQGNRNRESGIRNQEALNALTGSAITRNRTMRMGDLLLHVLEAKNQNQV